MRRPVLRYHGGKWRLAPWIISQFPAHRCYVEPFGGAGSVLMRKPRSYAEVWNDRWGLVVNVFRVLRDPVQAGELERLIRLTPFAREEFEGTDSEQMAGIEDPVERARRVILRSFAGFRNGAVNTERATGFRRDSQRFWTVPAHDWAGYPDHIGTFVERLQGVIIENRPAVDVIREHDSGETLFYVDPPYPHCTRDMRRESAGYKYEMEDDDHRALAAVLRGVEGMVVIGSYPCELYDEELYGDWKRLERRCWADGARERTEVLHLSPPVCERQLRLAI